MNKLHIKNLKFKGVHCKLAQQNNIPRYFDVEIIAEFDFTKSIETDDIRDTIDYKAIEKIVQRIIEGEPRMLIERLASDIADAILRETESVTVEVALTKPRDNTLPSPTITIKKEKIQFNNTETIREILAISKEKVDALYSPNTDGIMHLKGVIYKILDHEKLKEWYGKKWNNFQKKEEKYIQNNQEVALVFNGPFQNMQSSDSPQEIALHNLFFKIRNEIEKYSDIPFSKGDKLETKLIKYPISNLGVGAHKDLSSNINAIILFNLYGSTTFYTSTDKNRSNEKAYHVGPGDVVVMRGPRNHTEDNLRPTHYVLDIQEERLVFVCREIEDEAEARINKNNWMGF